MFCEKCGKEMLDTAKFCPSCGAVAEPGDTDSMVESKEFAEETVPVYDAEPEATDFQEEPVVKATVKKEPVRQAAPAPTYSGGKDLTKPLGTGSYFLMFFLMSIPLIGFIMLLVWSFSDNVNINKKHFAHAVFIWILVSLILTIVSAIVLFILFGSSFVDVIKIW